MPALIRTLAKFLAAVLFTAAGVGHAAAQSIAVDPATAVEAASSSVNMNHTVGSGSNRLLIVSVAIERDTDRVTAVTYAGQALTFVGTRVDPTNTSRLEVWRLIAPATGTNTVSVAFNSSSSVVVAAISFANVDQTNPIAASQYASGTGSSDASVSVASATDHIVLSAIAANDNVISVIPMIGQTSRWNVLNAADVIGAGSTTAGSSTTTMRYLLLSPQPWTMGAFSIRPSPSPLIVTNTNDSGSGSFRDAIQLANTQGTSATISFAIPGTGPHTILLNSELPTITANGLRIDGSTQTGTQCRDLWLGNGHNLRINVRRNGSTSFRGLRLAGTGQTIRGLSLTRFSNAVQLEATSTGAMIQCNYIGLLPSGASENNGNVGVAVNGASARIGGLNAGEGNVLASNGVAGITTYVGSSDTSIQGNFIGTDAAGMAARSSGTAIANQTGSVTWRDVTYNLIAGNTGGAIGVDADDRISSSTDLVRIQRNRIGFNRTLSALLLNGNSGIRFNSGSLSNALIGGIATSQGNEIAGTVDGISITGGSNVTIQGNIIARSGGRGIHLNAMNGGAIGGAAATFGNTIGGNGSDGIHLQGGSGSLAIEGNQIGAVTITGATFQNAGRGIFLENVSNITIGNGAASGRNVIASNGDRAIMGVGTNSTVTINGNYIGTNATGTAAVSNGANAGVTVRDAISFDSGGSFTNLAILNNVIGGYADAQLELFGSTGSGITIQGNNIGVGADGVSSIVSGNAQELVRIGGGGTFSNLLIGGTGAGQGNLLANSSVHGLLLDTGGSNIQVIGNTIRNNALNGANVMNATRAALLSNRIFGNGQIGIDLSNNGVTLNDSGDDDAGPNNLLNFPAITSVNVTSANQMLYSFTFDGPADGNGYRIEFFANSAADSSGFGEGETFLGHIDIVHNGGSQSYSGSITTLAPISIGSNISATATRKTAGGAWDITSEFSATATAQGVAELNVALATEPYDQGSGAAFSTPGSDVSLTATVTNTGSGSTQSNSIFTVISINNASSFFNAETPAFGGIVRFASTSPTLTFTPGTDLRFSNAATAPTDFAQCTYTPAAGYDPLVRYVCLNPKGSLPHSAPQNQFSVQLRARIN